MATKIQEWLDTWVKKCKEKKSLMQMGNKEFFRDPPRPHLIDQNYFFSPADGIILYQKQVEDGEAFLEVKGEEYTLPDLMQEPDFNEYPCIVIGVFMTFYDVHINRVPYSGKLNFKPLPTIESRNLPMLLVEKSIEKGEVDLGDLAYLKRNERMHNMFYNPRLRYKYYVIQIGDKDVSVITHYTTDQSSYFTQNERFSFIRWGSQVDLVLPLNKKFEFKFMQDTTDHVKAGLDPLVEISPRKRQTFLV